MGTSTEDVMAASVARQMWRTLEPFHGMIYFVPEAAEAYARAGIDDFRAGYFASRSAAMGAVPAEVVVATFYNFNPALVARAVPHCWEVAPPERMVAARFSVADAALRRLLGPEAKSPAMEEAADLARTAAEAPGLSPVGRPLYAGHASLPWPSEPHVVLWHAISLLREYRGDGHIAALVTEAVGGCEALVVHAATGEVPKGVLQQSRAWDDAEWAEAETALRGRGWLDADGGLTVAGRAHRERVEEATDRLALAPWQHLGASACSRLRELVRPWSRTIVDAGGLGRR